MMNFNIDQIEEHQENGDFLDMLAEKDDFSKEVDSCGLDLNYKDLDSKTMIDMMTDCI